MGEFNGQPRQAEVRKTDKTAEWIHEIKRLEEETVWHQGEALTRANRIGMLLRDLRKQTPEDEWEPLIAEKFQRTPQWANSMIRIADHWDKVLDCESINRALRIIKEINERAKGDARKSSFAPPKPKKPRKPKAMPAGSDGAHTTTPEVEALLDRFEELFNMTSGGALFTLRKILQEYGREPPKRN